MPQDWTTDEAEIPPSRSRQDMTLDKIGFARDHRPQDSEPTVVVIRTVVDNGEYEGFQLSARFSMHRENIGRFFEFLRAGDMQGEFAEKLNASGAKGAVLGLRDKFAKKARLSATVLVEKRQTDSEKVARYKLQDFDSPMDEASLKLKTRPTQFERNL